MIKLSTAIDEIIANNDFFQFGITEDLFNLSKLARMMQPLIEAKTKKDVTLSSITMHLSRISQRKYRIQKNQIFVFKKIMVHSGIASITYKNSPEVYEHIHEVYKHIKKGDEYITISHGTFEITLLVEERFLPEIRKRIPIKEKTHETHLSSVSLHFDEKYCFVPGLFYEVIKSLVLLGINIPEIASTHTELILYVHDKDRALVFEALERKFFHKTP